MNKKYLCIGAVAIAAIAGAFYLGMNFGNKNNKSQEYSADALECLKNLSDYTSDEAKEKLLKDFSKMDKADCTQIVDTYIYGTYNAAMQYTLSDDETNELMFVTPGSETTPDLSRLEDADMKQKFEDLLNEDHIIVRYVNGDIFYDVDYGYFIQSFGDYLNDDYKELLTLYDDEKNENYYDQANNEFYASVVTSRLDRLYQLLTKYPDSDILESIQTSYIFYKSVYLGAYAQEYIFDSGSIRQNVFDNYKEYVSVCKDEELKSFLSELIADYEESKLIRTVPIYEKIKTFCRIQEATAPSSITESSNN